MEVDKINGRIASAEVWPPIHDEVALPAYPIPPTWCNPVISVGNVTPEEMDNNKRHIYVIPAGYYNPSELKEQKRLQRARGRKVMKVRSINQMPKGSILKGPRLNKVKFGPTKVTLKLILDKSS